MSGSVPSFCSSAFLARPPDEMGTREHYQRTLRIEFTTRCWQLYLAKAGPAWDVLCLGQQALRSAANVTGLWRRTLRGLGRKAQPWKRTHSGRSGVEWAGRGIANHRGSRTEASVCRSRRRGARAGRVEFTAIHTCCSCSVGSVAMHAKPASRSEPGERHRSIVPVAGFSLSNQADQVRFDAGVSLDAPI